jgi:hypothetical protein
MSWFSIIVLVAQLSAAPNPVQRAYQKLTSQQIEAKRTTAKPPQDARRIDVSAKIRSASFGHKTWLYIAPDGKQFWVEYGRSTNTKAGLFGPFSVETPVGEQGPPPPPPQDPAKK